MECVAGLNNTNTQILEKNLYIFHVTFLLIFIIIIEIITINVVVFYSDFPDLEMYMTEKDNNTEATP